MIYLAFPIIFSLGFLSSCPDTIIVNESSHEVNNHDKATMKSCQERCELHYPGYPCLKTFVIKPEPNNYYCVCSAK
jgi:hypothetical protein